MVVDQRASVTLYRLELHTKELVTRQTPPKPSSGWWNIGAKIAHPNAMHFSTSFKLKAPFGPLPHATPHTSREMVEPLIENALSYGFYVSQTRESLL